MLWLLQAIIRLYKSINTHKQAFIITKKYHNIPTVNAGSFPHGLQVYKMCIRKMLN